MATISPEVIEDLKRTVYLMKWMEGRIREKLEMLAANMSVNSECETEDGNCDDTEAETQGLVKLNKGM
jgi:hypothetical protein